LSSEKSTKFPWNRHHFLKLPLSDHTAFADPRVPTLVVPDDALEGAQGAAGALLGAEDCGGAVDRPHLVCGA